MSAQRLFRGGALLASGALVACASIIQIDDKYKSGTGGGTSSVSSSASSATVSASSTSASMSSSSSGIMVTSNAPGCSDGSREAFGDPVRFPEIAGCSAVWPNAPGMRAPATGTACGNDSIDCPVAADACEKGWHVCMRNGYGFDLTKRISAADCAPPTKWTRPDGKFFAGSSQQVKGSGCKLPMPCNFDDGGWAIAICCGRSCYLSESNCAFGDKKTPFHGGPCATLGNGDLNNGVLCCKDPDLK
jgi:hypothetical protein